MTYKLMMFAIAILLASLVAGLSVALLPIAFTRTVPPSEILGVSIFAAFVAIPLVSVVGLLVAMPVAVLLKQLHLGGYIVWAIAGATSGALVVLSLAMLISGGLPGQVSVPDVLVVGSLGAFPGLMAGVFWWRAVARHEHEEAAVL